MKTVFYKKVGRRYVPVSEYDNEYLDSFPKGSHLVCVYPGGSSRRFNIDPDFAALMAASRYAEDAMSKALVKAGELRMQRGQVPLTPGQKAAWENLVKEFGDSAKQLEWPSAREVADEALKALEKEAKALFETNPTVKKAYDRLLMLASLAGEKQ